VQVEAWAVQFDRQRLEAVFEVFGLGSEIALAFF
jgi:hypothetical protein